MIKPKKSLGQNFLINNDIIKQIVSLENVKDKNILEIGPGTGNLTKEIIIKEPKTLTLVEKDKELFKKLEDKFFFLKNLRILNRDILELDIENNLKKDSIVFGNLPYNISTKILINLLKFKKWPPNYKRLVLMFQKEVGERIIASYNTSKYGRLSVISNFRLEVLKYFNVSKKCFYPVPKVDSMIIVFKPIKRERYKLKKIESLEKITNVLFSKKRKMINKALKMLFSQDGIKQLKIDEKKRPAELSLDEFYRVASYYESN